MVMTREPIQKPGFIHYRLPGNIRYAMWVKGTEWKWLIFKIKERNEKEKYVAHQRVYLTQKEVV